MYYLKKKKKKKFKYFFGLLASLIEWLKTWTGWGRGGVTRSKGLFAASVHGKPALPTELNGAPVRCIMRLNVLQGNLGSWHSRGCHLSQITHPNTLGEQEQHPPMVTAFLDCCEQDNVSWHTIAQEWHKELKASKLAPKFPRSQSCWSSVGSAGASLIPWRPHLVAHSNQIICSQHLVRPQRSCVYASMCRSQIWSMSGLHVPWILDLPSRGRLNWGCDNHVWVGGSNLHSASSCLPGPKVSQRSTGL